MGLWGRRVLACAIAIGLVANLLLSVGVTPAALLGAQTAGADKGGGDAALSALLADLKWADCHSTGRHGSRPGGGSSDDGSPDDGSNKAVVDACFDCRLCAKVVIGTPLLRLADLVSETEVRHFLPRDQRAERLFFVRPPSRGPPSPA